MIKTVVFQKEDKTVQATYVLDQRTKGIAELDYQILPAVSEGIVTLPYEPVDHVYTST